MISAIPLASALPQPVVSSMPTGAGTEEKGDGAESFAQALEDVAQPEAPAAHTRPGGPGRAGDRAADRWRDRAGLVLAAASAKAGEPAPSIGADAALQAEAADDAEAGADDTLALPAEVSGLLADLQSRHARPAAVPATTAATTAAPDDKGGMPAISIERSGGGGLTNSLPTPLPPPDSAAPTLPMPAPARIDAAAAELAPVAAAAIERSPARAEPLTTPTAPAAVQPAPLPATAQAAPLPEATLTAPPTSPEFAPQLGAAISTFVRDGIGHARLQLNPAELGPVSVQIQLDGQNAQVMLGADQAATRTALEQSLPLLAGSLREAGLTLAGGGVFEQHRQGRDGNDGATPGGRGTGHPEAENLPAPAAFVPRRGVVDLMA